MTKEDNKTHGNMMETASINLSPAANAARAAMQVSHPKPSIVFEQWCDHIEEIQAAIARIKANDLSDLEASLMSQVKLLERQFFTLSEQSARLYAVSPEASQRSFNMAMRCQKQLLKTVQVLHEFKNPKRSVFIRRQQNMLLQQQQPDQAQPEHVRSQDVDVRSQLIPSQQQEFTHAQMDKREQATAIPVDTHMETVGAQAQPTPPL